MNLVTDYALFIGLLIGNPVWKEGSAKVAGLLLKISKGPVSLLRKTMLQASNTFTSETSVHNCSILF